MTSKADLQVIADEKAAELRWTVTKPAALTTVQQEVADLAVQATARVVGAANAASAETDSTSAKRVFVQSLRNYLSSFGGLH